MSKLKSFFTLILFIAAFGESSSLLAQRGPDTDHRKAENTRVARALLRQAKVLALRIKNSFQHDLLLDEIGVAEATAGDLNAAIETANQMRYSAHQTLTAIGEELAPTSDVSKAQMLAKHLKVGEVSTILSALVQGQIKNRNLAGALTTAELLKNPEIRSYALESIATKQAANGDYAAARNTFARAREAHPASLVKASEIDLMIAASQFAREDVSAIRARIASFKSPDERMSLMLGAAEEVWKKGNQAEAWKMLDDALGELPVASDNAFWCYFAIPFRVRLGQRAAALQAAGALTPDLRAKGYMAVAVACTEAKDLACVSLAVEKMSLAVRGDQSRGISEFGLRLMILNVTAALIDNGQLQAADQFLHTLEQKADDVPSGSRIEPTIQLQRVLILLGENKFREARQLALTMRPDSITDVQRGRAIRLVAQLQTEKSGSNRSLVWARRLVNGEDRGYALLGIAQALLEIGEVKLGYSAIQIH